MTALKKISMSEGGFPRLRFPWENLQDPSREYSHQLIPPPWGKFQRGDDGKRKEEEHQINENIQSTQDRAHEVSIVTLR